MTDTQYLWSDDTRLTGVSWRTSSFSNGGGACVEFGIMGDQILLRDSKHQGAGPVLSYSRTEWAAFLAGAKAGEFDT